MTFRFHQLAVLILLVFASELIADESSLRDRNDAIIVRTIERMDKFDVSSNEHVQQAVRRHIAKHAGTAAYIELAQRFRPDDMAEQLAKMVASELNDAVRTQAAGLMLSSDDGRNHIQKLLKNDSTQTLDRVATAIAQSENARGRDLLAQVVSDVERPYDHRKSVVIAMTRNQRASRKLLLIARKKELPADARLLVGGLLARSNKQDIRAEAAELFPQPVQKDRKPLPAIDELARLKGNSEAGAKLFAGVATCGNCHPVSGQGKSVGPDLTEIGSKLSREAMLTSILDPSGGISHNYEGYVVLTVDGQVINGLLISRTDDEVIIRTTDAIDRKIASDDIESFKQSEKSIMPEDLHHLFDQQGLIDIVEYMTTLKKR